MPFAGAVLYYEHQMNTKWTPHKQSHYTSQTSYTRHAVYPAAHHHVSCVRVGLHTIVLETKYQHLTTGALEWTLQDCTWRTWRPEYYTSCAIYDVLDISLACWKRFINTDGNPSNYPHPSNHSCWTTTYFTNVIKCRAIYCFLSIFLSFWYCHDSSLSP